MSFISIIKIYIITVLDHFDTDYEEHVLEVNTEYWLDMLKDETFPTTFCPFKLEEAHVFMDIYKRYT